MTWRRFKEKFHVNCMQFEYESLVLSLPMNIKSNRLKESYQQPVLPTRLKCLLSNATFTNLFAKNQNKQKRGNFDDIARIENKWNRDIETFDRFSVFNIKNSVVPSRYVSFQYKLVMRILTTNTFLKIIGIEENDNCSFCQNEPETLAHLFLTCNVVARLWNDIAEYLRESEIGPLSPGVKIFGKENSTLINHIVTIAKYVIYDARRRNVRPSIDHFKNILKQDFETEQYIARKNDTFKNFVNKWKTLKLDFVSALDTTNNISNSVGVVGTRPVLASAATGNWVGPAVAQPACSLRRACVDDDGR